MEGEVWRGAQGDYGYKNTGRGKARTRGACLTATPLATASPGETDSETPLSDSTSTRSSGGTNFDFTRFSSSKRMQKTESIHMTAGHEYDGAKNT